MALLQQMLSASLPASQVSTLSRPEVCVCIPRHVRMHVCVSTVGTDVSGMHQMLSASLPASQVSTPQHKVGLYGRDW